MKARAQVLAHERALARREVVDLAQLGEATQDFIEQSEAPNTRRAHKADWKLFAAWCAGKRLAALPARAETVAGYLADLANTRKPATLVRYLASISVAHQAAGHDTPTRSLLVRKTLSGIKRVKGTAQTKKTPLLVGEIRALARALDTEQLEDLRDRALILVMFSSACRRSEIVALEVEDIEFTRAGFILTKRRSKTDQEGRGMRVPVAYGSTKACPVIALRKWIKAAQIEKGAIFRDVTGESVGEGLTDHTLARIIKRRVLLIGLNPKKFSGHSMRAGFVTSASAAGMDDWMIAKITGHKSMTILAGYRREADIEVGEYTKRIGL